MVAFGDLVTEEALTSHAKSAIGRDGTVHQCQHFTPTYDTNPNSESRHFLSSDVGCSSAPVSDSHGSYPMLLSFGNDCLLCR
jgi:hypothetical protein